MKSFLFVLFLLVSADIDAQTPSWMWAKSVGGVSNEYSNTVCSDANGNVYATGTFQGSSITFGSFTLNNTGTGTHDIFIVKYDPSGNVLWAHSCGGTSYDYAYGICVDLRGGVYITGFFQSPSIAFGTITLNNAGNYGDVFIAKYNTVGNIMWARNAMGSGADLSFGICPDASSNVYIIGMFGSDTITFGNVTLINKGYYDIFIAKYDSSGNILWAKNAGGTQWDAGQGICTDEIGNLYVTGTFQTSAIFDSDTIIGHSNSNIFLAKYDSNGNNLWAKCADGGNFGTGASGTGIAADANGNVYITGYYRYLVFLGDTLSNSNTNGVFIAKYDSGGNALWGRTPGGTGNDYGSGICIDVNGNIFVTGYFESSFLNFGGYPVLNANVGYDDVFVAEYDTSGNALWAIGVGGPDYDYGMGLCSNTAGDIYVTGYFGSYSLNFGSTTITNNGSYDIFLAKIGLPTVIEENSSPACNAFPNPFSDRINISITNNTLSEINIYDITSRKILRQEFINFVSLNTEQLAKGIYLYQVRDKNGVFKSGKVVKD